VDKFWYYFIRVFSTETAEYVSQTKAGGGTMMVRNKGSTSVFGTQMVAEKDSKTEKKSNSKKRRGGHATIASGAVA
jgi:hypothetical protein